ncbi:MAG: DUF4432 family protein [Candidatus Bathyarchaeia archaeon]
MRGCRATTDWTFKGMRTLILENENLRVVCLLDKGSDIMEIVYKPLDVDFMWQNEAATWRNPSAYVPTIGTSQASFLDLYGGGWQDCLPNPGGRFRGAEWGLHGESPLLPWDCVIEEKGGDEAVARLSVELVRYPFRVDKWMSIRRGEKSFTIRERLTNLSPVDLEFHWLQHATYGEPFLSPECRIDAGAGEVIVPPGEVSPAKRLMPDQRAAWPRVKGAHGEEVNLQEVPARTRRLEDFCVLTAFHEGWYTVTNQALKLGFGLAFDKAMFKHVWYWQSLGGGMNYPWWGRTWNIGLEPSTTIPGNWEEQAKRGELAVVKANSAVETVIKAVAYTGLTKVNRMTQEGTVE